MYFPYDYVNLPWHGEFKIWSLAITLPVLISIHIASLLMIGNDVIPNHGIVNRYDIGEGPDNILQCLTNNLDCCVDSGSWYYPDTTKVPDSGTDYYRSRGGPGIGVNLHRDTGIQEGIFRCETPDKNGVSYSRYVGVYGPGQGTCISFSYYYMNPEPTPQVLVGPAYSQPDLVLLLLDK